MQEIPTMIPWSRIECVMLDMDGTLLDLNFDTHFWLEHVPRCYAERRGVDIATAKRELHSRYKRVEGTMDWYCLDYWSRELELDVAALKAEVKHLIAVHPHVAEFLDALSRTHIRVLLVTNAHMKSLALKLDRTRLAGCFDAVICAHDIGIPKENPRFWGRLTSREPFDPDRTLLVDDSVAALRSARQFGFAHLLAVRQPDSHAPPLEVTEFPMLGSFRDILPGNA
jgi:5'-nucleotidase